MIYSWLYIGNSTIVLTNVDDCIIVGPSIEKIEEFVKLMEVGAVTLTQTDKGDIDKLLRMEITHLEVKIFNIS